MILNNKAYSLVETMLALGLLSMAISGALYTNITSLKTFSRIQTLSDESEVLQTLYANIRSEPARYQRSFESQSNTDALLLPGVLPIAWSNQYLGDAAGCPDCPGRAGYVLTPLAGYQGLQSLQIKLTHKNWEYEKKYWFIVQTK